MSFCRAVKDNTLYEDANGELSNGQGIYFFAGTTGQPRIRRTLIAFDLTSIPPNATVTGAKLFLYLIQEQGGPQAISLHAVLQDWGEGASDAGDPGGIGVPAATNDATWLHTFYDTGFWSKPAAIFRYRQRNNNRGRGRHHLCLEWEWLDRRHAGMGF